MDDNLKECYVKEGIELFAKMLFEKMTVTAKGDNYVLLFHNDLNEVVLMALREVNKRVGK